MSGVAYRFYGGKGGVGKTTCAAAHAIGAALAGRRTLLISTDPAPSAGDAIQQRLTTSPRPVPGTRGRLHAVEVRAAAALTRWLAPRRPHLQQIVTRGTWLDDEDVSTLLDLSLPGIDEIAGLLELGRFGRSGRYELLVVDTAPTGHTLRMLALPDLLRTLATVFDRMQAKHRLMVEAIRGGWTPDASDALLAGLERDARDLAALIRDPQSSAMSWVTLPEPMAIAETADALGDLRQLGVPVDSVVVNRLTPAPDGRCGWCTARRAFERRAIAPLLDGVARGLRVATVVARSVEPRGTAALAKIAGELNGRAALPPRGRPSRPLRPVAAGPVPEGGGRLDAHYAWSLLMCGGKGGVGKTTCAAAIAIDAASREPDRPVLLVSADPAHSLGDALGMVVGNEPRTLPGAPGNLQVREIDAAARFAALKAQYVEAIEALFQRMGGGVLGASSDRQAMQDLFELAPPGLDELVAVAEVSDRLSEAGAAARSLIVIDTAPSGHALRLLEAPALVHDWVKALMAMLLKYRDVVGIGELGEVLLRTSKGLGRLRALLADPARTAFVAVTRPAALPVVETVRLLGRLRSLPIAAPVVIVNAIGAGACGHCAAARRAQQRAVDDLRRSLPRPRPRVVFAPAVMPPPHGSGGLREWRDRWRVGVGTSRLANL